MIICQYQHTSSTTLQTTSKSQKSLTTSLPVFTFWTMYTGGSTLLEVPAQNNQFETACNYKRSSNATPAGHYVKCFHNSEHVLALHNHFPKACLGSKWSRCCQWWKLVFAFFQKQAFSFSLNQANINTLNNSERPVDALAEKHILLTDWQLEIKRC